jgi:hypothetical protein
MEREILRSEGGILPLFAPHSLITPSLPATPEACAEDTKAMPLRKSKAKRCRLDRKINVIYFDHLRR